MAQQNNVAKDIRSNQSGQCGRNAAKVVANDALYLMVAKTIYQHDHVSHEIRLDKSLQVYLLEVSRVPACGSAIASLVKRYDVVAGFRQRRHDLAPGIGQLGEAMKEKDKRATFMSSLDDVVGQV